MSRTVVEQALGRGGMGEVFRGRREGRGGFMRAVALKRVARPFAGDPDATRMLEEEARLASRLAHPNIVSVFDLDHDDEGQLWLSMELVDGPDVARLAERARAAGRPLSPGVCAFIGGELLRALGHAHANGVVHRDVTPHNVLVSRAGAVKLSDFGVAKVLATPCSGSIKGKIAYLSPEQAAGAAIDGRSDLFSLGVLLYELLGGCRPFQGQTEPEVLARILSGKVPPLAEKAPHVPRDLAAVVMRLLAPARERRYADAAAARRALMACRAWPRDGVGELAAAVAAMVAEDPACAPTERHTPGGAPRSRTETDAAGEGATAVRSARRDECDEADGAPLALSRRSLRALAVGALISLALAVSAWSAPRPGGAPVAHRGASMATR